LQIFLSWSGLQSKGVAECLRDLLPDLLHNVTIWMSEHDITAGMRWSTELSERLSNSDVGIACVTPSNQHSPWLMFEAGAISKSLSEGRLIPYLFGISPEQIDYPLAQFQMRESDREGTFRLVMEINSYTDNPIDEVRFLRLFDRWWPDFSDALERLSKQIEEPTIASIRSDKEILYEILDTVRALSIAGTLTPDVAPTKLKKGLFIDTRPLLGNEGEVFTFPNVSQMSVADFLDRIWFKIALNGRIPAYTYSQTWVLHSSVSNTDFKELGSSYINSRGLLRDLRSLTEAGILSDDVLEVRAVYRKETRD
jgi:hypothetical protein